MSFSVIPGVLAAAVATSGTFSGSYPAGTTRGDFQLGVKHQLVVLGKTYNAPADFTVALGASVTGWTVTWKGATTIPSGSAFKLQLDQPGVFGVTEFANPTVGGLVVPTPIKRVSPMRAFFVKLGAPIATIATNIRAAAASTGTTPFTLLLTELDVPRNLIITSSGNDSGVTFTVLGKDEYGQTMSEVITGANAGVAAGVKAFKTLTSITPSASAAANVSVGVGNVLGLPIWVGSPSLILSQLQDFTTPTAGTLVAGLSPLTVSTTTTADVRGTIVPNAAPDGTKAYELVVLTADPTHIGNPQA